MKKTLLLAMIVCFTLQAQFIAAQTDTATAKGISNSLSIEVDNVSRKDAEKIWKNLIKRYDGKTKKGKNNEWYTEKINAPKIGPQGSVKMFMSINEKDRKARTTFLVSKDGEFINYNNNPTEAEEVESIFQDYVYDLKKKSYDNETKKEENNLKDLNKDLEKLEKNNKKYHEEIEKCKKKIAEMESKIIKNEEDQITKKEEVAAQKVQVEKVLKKISTHKR